MIGPDMTMVCASNVALATMEKVIHVKSRGDPLALDISVKQVVGRDEEGQSIMVTGKDGQPGPKRRKAMLKWPIRIKAKQDAVTITYAAMVGGSAVDMSYVQVSSSDLSALGFTVEDTFDDCKNLAAGASVLSAFYACTLKEYPDLQTAPKAALPAYNTGNSNKSYLNDYLACYGIDNPAVNIPAIDPYTIDATAFVRQPSKKEEVISTKEKASSTQQIAESAKAVALHVGPVVSQSQEDGTTPGVQVEHTTDAAEANGVLHETAMSESDVWESNADLVGDPSGAAIMLKGEVVRPTALCSVAGLAKTQPVRGGN